MRQTLMESAKRLREQEKTLPLERQIEMWEERLDSATSWGGECLQQIRQLHAALGLEVNRVVEPPAPPTS